VTLVEDAVAPLRFAHQATLIPAWEYWVVYVPEAGGVHAIVLSLPDAERVARDAVGVVIGVDPARISISIQEPSGGDAEPARMGIPAARLG